MPISGESSFVLWAALAIIVFRLKGVAWPYENLFGFSMRESEWMHDSQISYFTSLSITRTLSFSDCGFGRAHQQRDLLDMEADELRGAS